MSAETRLRTVLLVEDDEALRTATVQALELAGFEPRAYASPERARRELRPGFAGCLVTDIRMEGMDGLELMRAARAIDPEIPVILITGHGDVAMAVAALKEGAFDFLAKPFSSDHLAASVARALQARTLVLENRRLRRDIEQAGEGELVGMSDAMAQLRTAVGQVAMIDLDVLLEGEVGTGKEFVARALHRRSARALMPFTALRCSWLDEGGLGELLARPEGGVLFLDEVEALPAPAQARLLAHIEQRERQGEGARRGVHIVAATRADLEGEVRAGSFREDLFYRLGVLRLRLPPLRERREDIPMLFAEFVREALDRTRRKRFDLSAADRRQLLEYDWPGNARELRNFAYSAVLKLPRPVAALDGGPGPKLADKVSAYERTVISEAMEKSGGRVTGACAILGISRQTLYEKIARHSLDLERYRQR